MRRCGWTRIARWGGVFLLLAVSSLISQTTPPSSAQTNPPTGRGQVQSQAAVTPATPAPQAPAAPKLTVKATYQEQVGDLVTASGSVEIHYGDTILYADQVVCDLKTKDVEAIGHVSLIRPDEAFTADRLKFNLDTTLGHGENIVGLVQPQYRYVSTEIERKTPSLFSLGKSTITACSQPVPRWEFSVSRADFMRDEYIKMWNLVLRIKNIPVFYLPYLKYPLNQERATGFMMPLIGYSKRKGYSVTQQFYLAISRSMDAMFSLDYYSAKGVGAGLEYRYLFAGGSGGQLNAYYFVYNSQPANAGRENPIIFRWQHNQSLPGKITFVANVDYQNSFSFMRDFDNNYARALIYNRSSQVYLSKNWTGANLSVRVSRFETSFPAWDQSLIRQSLPQISFSTFRRNIWGPIYYSLSAAYNNWQYGISSQYDKGTERKSSELWFSPTLSVPINTIPWLTLDLTAAGNASVYGNSLDPVTKVVVDKNLWSGNYTLSASLTGPIFYRIFTSSRSGTKIKHLIEPNITYRYDSPTIDSDRIVTMTGYFFRYHYVSYGLTNHVLIKKGTSVKERAREIFTWGINQSFYLDAEESPLSRYTLKDGSHPRFSDISTYVRFFPLESISLDLSAGYNTYFKTLSSVRAAANLGNPAGPFFFSVSWYKSLNPYYIETFSNREQLGLSGGAKIPGLNLEAFGEFEYNVKDNKIIYSAVSAVWHYQCIDFKANVRAYFFREPAEVQFRFSIGLGNISSSSDPLGGKDILDSSSGGAGRGRG